MNAAELISKIESVKEVLIAGDDPFALSDELKPASNTELAAGKKSLISLIKNSDGKKYSDQSELHRLVFGSRQLRGLTDIERELLNAATGNNYGANDRI